MIKVKIEIIADTMKGKRHLGTREYELEVGSEDWELNQNIDQILVKDSGIGRYFLQSYQMRFTGKDMDKEKK